MYSVTGDLNQELEDWDIKSRFEVLLISNLDQLPRIGCNFTIQSIISLG